MANKYTTNKDAWRDLADIDYYSMFVKAYIPFNAWLSVTYPKCNTDREMINTIKKDNNPFRKKICALIEDDSSPFKSWIGELHGALENCLIENQDRTISFTNTRLGKNPNNTWTDTYRGLKIFIQYGSKGTPNTNIIVTIKNRKGDAILNIQQTDYNLDDLENNPKFQGETTEYKLRIKDGYKSLNPHLETNLLYNNNGDYFQCGNFKFIKDSVKISQALIEILYNMRNSLFHGELIPSKKVNNTYGVAYRILRTLIDAI